MRKRSTEQDVMSQIREGMEAYDSAAKRIGRVASLHMGAEADSRWPGTSPATPTGIEEPTEHLAPATAFLVSGATDDELPEVLRKRLLQSGYIRIDRGLLGRDVYATRDQIAEIVELQLARLRERLAEWKISLELTEAAKQVLAEEGWDPAYGARPLKRAIQRRLENELARELLEGRFGEGDTVRVDAADGELVFERAGVTQPAAA
jgi:ATP-dependent Clp protease ATP-binding subunit ClpB